MAKKPTTLTFRDIVLGAEAGYQFAVREKIVALFIVRTGATLTLRPTPVFAQRFSSGG
jgi:hypothetical protein